MTDTLQKALTVLLTVVPEMIGFLLFLLIGWLIAQLTTKKINDLLVRGHR